MLRRIQILVIISIAMLAGCNSVKEEFTKLSQGDVVDVDDGKCLILTAESEAHPLACVYTETVIVFMLAKRNSFTLSLNLITCCVRGSLLLFN